MYIIKILDVCPIYVTVCFYLVCLAMYSVHILVCGTVRVNIFLSVYYSTLYICLCGTVRVFYLSVCETYSCLHAAKNPLHISIVRVFTARGARSGLRVPHMTLLPPPR